MDAFRIIQHFFSRMHCQHCQATFSSEDIELLRREESVYVVNVFCNKCDTSNGVALVGMDITNLDDLQESDLDTAEFDFNLGEPNMNEAVAQNFSKNLRNALESVPGKIVVPEEILMQLLEQAGSMGPNVTGRKRNRFQDPELTNAERQRLAQFAPIKEDDVLDAHHFFQNLDKDWMRFIPEEMRQSQTVPHTESQAG